MLYIELPPYLMAQLTVTSLTVLFLSIRARRDRNLRTATFLLLDFASVTILPFISAVLGSLDFATTQRLLLSGLIFYLTLGIIYYLFTSDATRLLIPFTSLYLFLALLQLLAGLFYDNNALLSPVLSTYYFIDQISLATLIALFLTILLPLFRQLRSKIIISIDSRHLTNIVSSIDPKNSRAEGSLTDKDHGATDRKIPAASLRNAIKLYREGKYRQCIETCDAEVERTMLSNLAKLYSTDLSLPMSLQEQVSALESKAKPVAGKDILQLRKLRNTLTMSSNEATVHQAKWAIKVARRATQALANLEDIQHTYVSNGRAQCERIPQ